MVAANPNTAQLLTPTLADVLAPQDPKKKLLYALAMQGADTSPVQHWTQGAARLANALMGNYELYKDDIAAKQREADLNAYNRADPALGGSGVPVYTPVETGNSVPKLLASLFGGGQPAAPLPASAIPMGGVIGQPAPVAPMVAPVAPPPPMVPGRPSPLPATQLGAMPDVPATPQTRPEVMPSARVWGDKEAEAAGLYEPAPGATPATRVADTFAAAYGRPPVAAAGASPVTQAAPPPPVASPPVPPGAAPTGLAQPRRIPTIDPVNAAYIRAGQENPATRVFAERRKAELLKPNDNPAIQRAEELQAKWQEYGFKGPNDPDLVEAKRQIMSGVTSMINLGPNKVAEGLGAIATDSIRDARTAISSTIPSIHNARRILDSSAGIFTGPTANVQQNLQRLAGVFGLPTEAAANTQVFGAEVAKGILANAAMLKPVSNVDMTYLQKMAAGDIQFDEKALRRILDIQERSARSIIRQGEEDARGFLEGPSATKYRESEPMLRRIRQPDEYVPPAPVSYAPPATQPQYSREQVEAELRRRGLLRVQDGGQ